MHLERRVADAREELDRVALLAVPRRQAGEHLERDDAEAPPIRREAVAALIDDLGCHVLGRAAERARALGRLGDARAREAKVGELEVAGCVEHAVLGLPSYGVVRASRWRGDGSGRQR